MYLTGLHHVTAVTADAQLNLRFYTGTLGMRLVKKTVNQDDVSAYHLFYADALGSPGTELTFFDWGFAAARRHGTGTISEIGLRVPDADALEWWGERFAEHAVEHGITHERNNRLCLPFNDGEGQRLILIADDAKAGDETANETEAARDEAAWHNDSVPPEVAIRGLSHVTLTVNRLEPTAHQLTAILGFRLVGSYTIPASDDDDKGEGKGDDAPDIFVFATGTGGTGAEVHVAVRPTLPRGTAGRGGVHHVAFRTPDNHQHREWQRRLAEAKVGVTPVIDRFYFRSLYFREPGGVLFEIATDGPGFATDEPLAHLGERLSLPPFLEPNRARIEANLKPLSSPPSDDMNHGKHPTPTAEGQAG
ncbi:MAG: ring-cleaving dioxygenase [Pyrinomonadaceae bacterium MAG19_C2-C3]|nr:ring-cleaving dioxygenase [Pyrinomonadaceae bacterium MAG19_C2-C3]